MCPSFPKGLDGEAGLQREALLLRLALVRRKARCGAWELLFILDPLI